MTEKAKLGRKVSRDTILINGLLVVLKLIVGLISRSSVLVADAFHSLTDILSTAFVYFGITISNKPADEDHPYGHEKAELIVSKIIALILFGTGIGIIINAVNGIQNEVLSNPSIYGLVVVIFSIFANEFMFYYSVRVGKKIGSNSLIADGWHHRSDSFSSIAALVGVVGSMLGYSIIDPIAAIIVAIIIMKAGAKIYWQSIKELMDTAPSNQTIELMRNIVNKYDKVLDIKHIKAIFHLNHIDVNIDVFVDGKLSVHEGYDLIKAIEKNLQDEIDIIQDIDIDLIPR
jgi:cation diffusion facilitator family transporter